MMKKTLITLLLLIVFTMFSFAETFEVKIKARPGTVVEYGKDISIIEIKGIEEGGISYAGDSRFTVNPKAAMTDDYLTVTFETDRKIEWRTIEEMKCTVKPINEEENTYIVDLSKIRDRINLVYGNVTNLLKVESFSSRKSSMKYVSRNINGKLTSTPVAQYQYKELSVVESKLDGSVYQIKTGNKLDLGKTHTVNLKVAKADIFIVHDENAKEEVELIKRRKEGIWFGIGILIAICTTLYFILKRY